MAENLGSAILVLSTDDSKLNKGIDSAKKGAEQLDNKFKATARSIGASMSRAGKSMRKFGKSTRQLGQSVSLKLTAPILAMGVGILKMAADFEKGMNQVRALTGATGETFTKLQDQAKELGATTQFSAGQAADAMGFLAQAGFDANQIYQAMPATLNLAASAQMDLGTAADIVSNVMTGYGLKTEEASRATDVLTATFTSSNTNLAQLGDAMKFVGPVASAFGIRFEETAAAIGLMGNAGLQGSLAGTALRGALTRLADPSKKAARIMKELGINVKNSDGSMKSLVEIVRNLETSGADASQMMTIFGQRAGPAMLALVAQGSGALEKFTAKLDESGGTAERIAKVQMEGLSGSMKAFTSALEAVAIAIADSGLLQWATDLVTALAGWFRELAKTNPEILKWGVVIAGVAAAAGPLMVILGVMVTALGVLISPIGLVVVAIAALVGGIIFFRKEIAEGWQNALVAIDAGVAATGKAIGEFKDKVIGFARDIFNGIKTWLVDKLTAVWNAVGEKLEMVAGFFKGLFDKVVGDSIIPDMVTGIDHAMTVMEDSMIQAATRARLGVQLQFEQMVNTVGSLMGAMSQLFSTMGPRFFQTFKAFAIAQALINTYTAFTAALRLPLPPPFPQIAAAAALVSGLAKVNLIRQQQPPEMHAGGVVNSSNLASFPGARPSEGLAILREGERVLTGEQDADRARQITIRMPSEDALFSKTQIRSLVAQIQDAVGDDSARLQLQVV